MDNFIFAPQKRIDDGALIALYEGNGLFAKIIDTPAEEATRRSPTLRGNKCTAAFVADELGRLEWDEQALTAVRWARLFGGAIAVMLVDDGGRLEDPLRVEHVKSVADLRIFSRSQIETELVDDQPEYFHIASMYGGFTAHASRRLTFRNDRAPELSENTVFHLWGIPEFYRVNEAVQRAALASSQTVKMLDLCGQAVYKAHGISAALATEDGEQQIMRRLQVLDMARRMLNTVVIDAEGESYDFLALELAGRGEIAEIALRYLAAVSRIPPEILYNYRSPHWWRKSSPAATENNYNAVEGIQHRMLRGNVQRLVSLILRAGKAAGEIPQIPTVNIAFPPLWSESAVEKATAAQSRAAAQLDRAKAIQTYMETGAVGRQDVRPLLKKLKNS